MMQLQLKQFVGDSPMNDGAELLGDPAEDEEWLEIMQKVFGETGTSPPSSQVILLNCTGVFALIRII